MSVILECKNLTFSYDSKCVLEDYSCVVEKGEMLSIAGPSGCGKTSLLRLMAGLEKPEKGEIWLRGEKVAGGEEFIEAAQRKIGFVFQNFALFEKTSVRNNIYYGCKNGQDHEEAGRLIDMMNLSGHLDKKPHQLSGGERQRVALARTLALKPDLIFLDEPFSNIDFDQTEFLLAQIKSLFKKLEVTALMVTHSKEESRLFSDRVLQFQ